MLMGELFCVHRRVTTLTVGDFGTILAWVRKSNFFKIWFVINYLCKF